MAKSLEEVEALLAKATIIPGNRGMEVKEDDLDDIQQKMFDLGYDTKTRHVRDAAYWGLPVGTPIAPGQKPVGGRSGGRGGGSSSGGGNIQSTRTTSSVRATKPSAFTKPVNTPVPKKPTAKAPTPSKKPVDPRAENPMPDFDVAEVPGVRRDKSGKVINPDATGGYLANIPEEVDFGGDKITPEHSLWHHLEEDPAKKGSYRLTRKRAAMHKAVIDKLTKDVPVQENPTMYMLGGGPAAGKSTIVRAGEGGLPPADKAVQVNADDLKEAFPEYERMRFGDTSDFYNAASFAHEESSMLSKQLQNVGVQQRKDIVLDGTGNSKIEALEKKIGVAKKDGYKVHAVYATIPTDEAWNRAVTRSKKRDERRYVPEFIVRGTHKSVSIALPQAIERGLFDNVQLYDTSGELKLIGKGTGSDFEVADKAGWDSFLAKGKE